MSHRHDKTRGESHTATGAAAPPHYAGPRHASLYNGLPSATNRVWGPDRSSTAYSYGYDGQGGYGDASLDRANARAGASGQRGRGPRDYVRPDDRIADDIISRLTEDARIDAREIVLMVQDGVVTLTGNVPERQMKHCAEDRAAEASGVREVRNTIRVDDGSASFGKPGEAVRSGKDQLGSAFSSSARPDPVWDNVPEDSNWHPGPPDRHD
jgi:hypothetical protein